ncbi:glycerol-3-phosphate 1-O-acyltransferase PlsY [Massilia sp. METH4]|uniref:glycerol-3-phosphate 1-O-acyltransferase PlsY n=1 Tax=Massilia sp. METH4 TaxID=3123041 RepID=UPI0030D2ACE7
MTTILLAIAAYLIGSISFAVVVSKAYGLSDPRTYGSGNPGATNVLRSGNKGAAVWTLIGDAFKGWLAVWLTIHFQKQLGIGDGTIAIVALAVFVGHLWPVFFRFEGGKGVATAAGVLLALDIWLGLATLATWLIVAYAFRYSSLAALVASVFAPFYYGLLFGVEPQLFAVVVMCGLLIWRHARNIGNLMAGKESRIGSKSKAAAAAKKK